MRWLLVMAATGIGHNVFLVLCGCLEAAVGGYGLNAQVGKCDMAKPVRSTIPTSFKATPEEDKFFEEQRKADLEEQVEEQEESVEETEAEPEAEEATPDGPEQETEGEQDADETETAEEVQSSEDEPKGRKVPIGELYAEREKRKQAQAKLEQMEAKVGQLENTYARVMERLNGQQQPQQPVYQAPAIPAYEADPVAHLKAKIDQLEGGVSSYGQQMAQRNAMEQFQQALGYLEGQYRTQAPDYDAAVEFAKQQRDAELSALGYNEEARANILRQEIIGVSASAMQRGQNPAEVFYNYAKVKGWGRQQQAAPAPAPAPKPAPAPAQKLATVAKAQSASRSLPKGGAAPKAGLTLADLATMDDAEFDKNFDRVMRRS